MGTALLVGLIAAATAILGTIINFFSSVLGHWYSRNTKLEEWKLAKQAARVENIAANLSELTSEVDNIILQTRLTYGSLQTASIPVRKLLAKDDVSINTEATKVVLEFLKQTEDSKQELSDNFREAFELAIKLTDWRVHKAPRLAVWLENKQESIRRLQKLARGQADLTEKTMKVMEALMRLLVEVAETPSPDSSKLVEIDKLLQDVDKQFIEIDSLRRVYTKESVVVEAVLAAMVMSTSSTLKDFLLQFSSKRDSAQHKSDGLLVWLARRVEQWVRWFLR